MALSRKRKKELRKLQNSATQLWETQQALAGDAAGVAREAGRQLGNFGREQVVPTVQHAYESRVQPVVDRGVRAGKRVIDDGVVPLVGGVVGSAMSVWDHANVRRARMAAGDKVPFLKGTKFVPEQPKKRRAGGIIAIVLGAAAAAGVLYAMWQTLRADDELWVADDPLSAPEA